MEKNDVKVSIMMLAYNHEKYIRETLDSLVIQQANFRYEIVIGEDCSTDNTRQIIMEYYRKYPDVIVPVFRKKNLGATRNSVSTFRYCKGEYITFVEGDDFWTDPLKIQKQADFLDKNKDYAGVFCDTLVVSRYGKPIATSPLLLKHEIASPLDYVKTLYPDNEFKFCGSMMVRNVFRDRKHEKYLLQTEYIGDLIVQPFVLCHGKLGFINEKMAAYRWVPSHGENFSAMKSDFVSREKIQCYRIMRMLFPKETYYRLYMRTCREHWVVMNLYFRRKEYINIIKYFIKEVKDCEKVIYTFYWIRREIIGKG